MVVNFGGHSPILNLVLRLFQVPVMHYCPSSRMARPSLFDGTIQVGLKFGGHLIHSDIDIMKGDIIELSDDMAISFLLLLLHLLRSQSLQLLHHRVIISVIEVPLHVGFVLMSLYCLKLLMQEQVLLGFLQLLKHRLVLHKLSVDGAQV